jgi:hypothetical protein
MVMDIAVTQFSDRVLEEQEAIKRHLLMEGLDRLDLERILQVHLETEEHLEQVGFRQRLEVLEDMVLAAAVVDDQQQLQLLEATAVLDNSQAEGVGAEEFKVQLQQQQTVVQVALAAADSLSWLRGDEYGIIDICYC